MIIADYNNYDFGKNKYSIVNAQATLFFNSEILIKKLLNKICIALQEGGYFSGNFFGKRDHWNKQKLLPISFYDIKSSNELLKKFEIKNISEVETDTKLKNGRIKHWHTINFVARKPMK